MDFPPMRPIGAVLKDRNIILKGADAATARGFTQVPNFLLTAGSGSMKMEGHGGGMMQMDKR